MNEIIQIRCRSFPELKLCLLFSCRLRCLVKQLDKGEVNVVDLRKNIDYAASVLEAVYIDETR